LRVPIFGSDELREERSVVMAPFALDALRRSIEHNQRMRLSGATLPGRIGLAHNRKTVSIPDRSDFSCTSVARRVPRGVNFARVAQRTCHFLNW
jgi:hypothetical protein